MPDECAIYNFVYADHRDFEKCAGLNVLIFVVLSHVFNVTCYSSQRSYNMVQRAIDSAFDYATCYQNLRSRVKFRV